MIVPIGKYYLYRHIRLDTNEVFYVGIGTAYRNYGIGFKKRYNRAYRVDGRSEFWCKIVSKTAYNIEILFESDDRDFVEQKEKEFISLYGRRDTRAGTLVNLTDGGDGASGFTEGDRKGRTIKMEQSGKMAEVRDRARKMGLSLRGRKNSGTCKVCFIYDSETGSFIRKYESATDCAKDLKIHKAQASKFCKGNFVYKKWIFSYRNLGDKINPNDFNRIEGIGNKVLQMCPDGIIVHNVFNTAPDAARFLSVDHTAIYNSIHEGYLCKGFKFASYDSITGDIEINFKEKKTQGKPVQKLDSITRRVIEEYPQVIDAAKANSIPPINLYQAIRENRKSGGFYWILKLAS